MKTKLNFREKKHRTIAGLVFGYKVLDIGFAECPNKFLLDPIGVDIQKVDELGNYEKVYQVNLNLEPLPFEDNYFDTVIAGEVIEHVENPSFVLREINRVLKPNRTFIVSVPQANYYWNIIRDYLFDFIDSMDEGEHLNSWTILDFKRLLKKNGFKVIKKYGSVFTFPPPLRWKVPVKHFPKLSWIIIYQCLKVSDPITDVLTRKQLEPYGRLNEGFIKVQNKKYYER